jgi:cytochrome c556
MRALFTFRTVCCTVCALGLASAASASEADVKYRQANMEVIGGHMHSIVPIVKGEVRHMGQLKAHAEGIAAASKLAPDAFKIEAMEGKTTAKKTIWTDWDTFADGLDKMGAAASKLAEVADSGDMAAIGPAVQSLGKTCKGCHDDFREEDH